MSPLMAGARPVFKAAAADAGLTEAEARAAFPRGAIDLAMAFHRRADRALAARLAETDLGALRFRERVALAVKIRLDLVEDHKEAVRRGATLFALPIYAADGARLVWETADLIWTALGDTSEDLNWYTKRAILSGVYSSTVLYWLGDGSNEHSATWDFLDRRIADVMRFEEAKAAARGNAPPQTLCRGVRPPRRDDQSAPRGRGRRFAGALAARGIVALCPIANRAALVSDGGTLREGA